MYCILKVGGHGVMCLTIYFCPFNLFAISGTGPIQSHIISRKRYKRNVHKELKIKTNASMQIPFLTHFSKIEWETLNRNQGCRDRNVVGFTTTCAIKLSSLTL